MNEIYERADGSRGVRTVPVGHSLTKQAMKDECDINNIMKKFERTGVITHNAVREAYFADVTEVPDYAAAVDIVRKAEDMFQSLPAKLRARFDNDPAAYVAFTSNPANEKEMAELGLLVPPVVVPPLEVVVTNPASAPVEGV